MSETLRPEIKRRQLCCPKVASGKLGGGYYRHYKGTVYRVFGVARAAFSEVASEKLCCTRYSEDENTWMVIYGNAHGDWVRPAENFSAQVNDQEQTIPRFEFLEEAIR